MKLLILIFTFCIVFIPQIIFEQTQSVSVNSKNNLDICSKEFVNSAKDSFARRWENTEIHSRAEKDLMLILNNCPDLTSQSELKSYLKVLQEERADQLYKISLYYLKRFSEKKIKSPVGGCLLLKQIKEKYPDYSQIDAVDSLLKADVCSAFFQNHR